MLLFCGFILLSTACEKDNPEITDSPEVITTLRYRLSAFASPPNLGTVEFSFSDLDGDGGNEPIVTGGVLQANTTYTGSFVLLNEQEDPAEDVLQEIFQEKEEHQFFFVSDNDNIMVEYIPGDVDANGNPVGILTNVTTGEPGDANLTIILRHEPMKNAENDPITAGGETDIQVTFPITVQ